MFYKPNGKAELSQAEMERVRKGFTGLLCKLRYHPEFILNHRDELLATAHLEYVRYRDKGTVIEDPVAWTIHCAWRRTQNLLVLQGYRPQEISAEKLAELVDEAAPTPEQIALDTDRARKVRRAVGKLEEEQRQLLALVYFEEMPLAEAARHLGWHESKARRCHTAALKRLYKILAVKSSDQIAEIGLAAWLSCAATGSGFHLPAGFEAVLDKASHSASDTWARAHDVARRLSLSGGGDAAGAVASSGAGRAAGVCATVAVACVVGASGVVGPGIDGTGLLGGHDHRSSAAGTHERSASAPLSATSTEAPSATVPGSGESPESQGASGTQRGQANDAGAKTSLRQAERNRVRKQTEGVARASSESSPTTASTTSTASASSTSSVPSTDSSASSGAAQAKQQFGAFK